MKRSGIVRMVLGSMVLAVGLPLSADFPATLEEQLTPGQSALVEAIGMPAGNLRDERVRVALRNGFEENDKDLQLSFWQFVVSYGQRLGLGAHRDLISRYRETYPDPRVVDGLTAEFAWEALSPDRRSVVYREALEKGIAMSDGGLTISRLRAVRSVALEGISELKVGMEEAWSRLSEKERASLPSREALRVILTLSAGASSVQGDWVAAKALGKTDSRTFSDRMGGESGFREAVTLLAKWACARPQPWLPESPGCEQMRGVVLRQEKVVAVGGAPPEWLLELRNRVRP